MVLLNAVQPLSEEDVVRRPLALDEALIQRFCLEPYRETSAGQGLDCREKGC